MIVGVFHRREQLGGLPIERMRLSRKECAITLQRLARSDLAKTSTAFYRPTSGTRLEAAPSDSAAQAAAARCRTSIAATPATRLKTVVLSAVFT